MLGNVSNSIGSRDPSMACLQLAHFTDIWHSEKLKKIGDSIENFGKNIRSLATLKRGLGVVNNGNQKTYDVSHLSDKLLDIQDLLNEGLDEKDKVNFKGEEIYNGLKNMSVKDLEALSQQIEDKISEIKDKTGDASNQLYMQGHLYTLIMNIHQEIMRTAIKGQERFAQARPH